MENKYIFVALVEESGQVFAGRKIDMDGLIKDYEDKDQDLPFTIIGKVQEPFFGLPVGFDTNLIQWYDRAKGPSEQLIAKAALAIIQLIS